MPLAFHSIYYSNWSENLRSCDSLSHFASNPNVVAATEANPSIHHGKNSSSFLFNSIKNKEVLFHEVCDHHIPCIGIHCCHQSTSGSGCFSFDPSNKPEQCSSRKLTLVITPRFYIYPWKINFTSHHIIDFINSIFNDLFHRLAKFNSLVRILSVKSFAVR